jgi:hypothetical protein
MVDYPCPFCGKTIKFLHFGEGWIGMCCKQIIYNFQRLPGTAMADNVETAKGEMDDNIRADA